MLRSALCVAKRVNSSTLRLTGIATVVLGALIGFGAPRGDRLAHAQAPSPTMTVATLGVRAVATGLAHADQRRVSSLWSRVRD